MVEESEEVQSQEIELEAEKDSGPSQSDVTADVTDSSSSQEKSAPDTEATLSQRGVTSDPEDAPALSGVTATEPRPGADPEEADAPQESTSVPAETK